MYSWLTALGAGGTALTALGLLLHRFRDRRVIVTREVLYVLAMATRDAEQRGHRPVSVTHMALALLADPSIARLLEERGVSLKNLYNDVEKLLPPRADAPLKLTSADGEPGIEALLRASRGRLGVVPAPHRILRALLRSQHDAVRAVFEKHGLTAKRWPPVSSRSAVVEVPPPSTPETGPYRGVPIARANTDVVLWNDKKTTMEFVTELRIEAPHLRIVSDDLWTAAQAQMRKNKVGIPTTGAKKKGGRPHSYLLSGLARCASCGGALTVLNSRDGMLPIKVYVCGYRRDRGETVCANKMRRPVERVNDAVIAWVHSVRGSAHGGGGQEAHCRPRDRRRDGAIPRSRLPEHALRRHPHRETRGDGRRPSRSNRGHGVGRPDAGGGDFGG